MADLHGLISQMAAELDHCQQLLRDDRRQRHPLADHARAALAEADGPAVPDGREPASVTDQPTDKELLALMPETMKDEFSYAARVCSDATGGKVKPGIFRVALNTAALEYARAVLGAADAKPTPNPSQIRSSLVERVRRAIVEHGDGETYIDEARAAIYEVAYWLREQHDGDLVAATVLEREAGR